MIELIKIEGHMFGRILEVYENYVYVENVLKKVDSTYSSLHCIFEGNNYKIVGQIVHITAENFKISLIGEIKDNNFNFGLIKKPRFDCKIRMINTDELSLLLGNQQLLTKKDIYLGTSSLYPGYKVSSSINTLFSNHLAIIGNTGSGKSCSFARIMQNLFYRKENLPVNSRFIIFDVYGEYNNAFSLFTDNTTIQTKQITTKSNLNVQELLNIPTYLLEVDDLCLLLNVTDSNQIPIIEKTLLYVSIFKNENENAKDYKNAIIAKALFDILVSGRTPMQIRDQVVAILSNYNTPDLSLESKIKQPGYVRTLRQCLNIDDTGKMNNIQLVIESIEPFIKKEVELKSLNIKTCYGLKDLYYALEFALISEGSLKSDAIFDKNNVLKVRLESLMNSTKAAYFDYPSYIDKDKYINKLFITNTNKKAQIVCVNLNFIDERFAKTITKILSKMIFDYAVNLPERASFPVQIVLEEAHRYVKDETYGIIAESIFDRITKEGRKYGVTLILITQRPSEISNTVLSQCSNFIIFRMFHPKDLEIISSINLNARDEILNELKSLRPGVGIGFGNAFKIPQFIAFDLPNPMPKSTNTNLEERWF